MCLITQNLLEYFAYTKCRYSVYSGAIQCQGTKNMLIFSPPAALHPHFLCCDVLFLVMFDIVAPYLFMSRLCFKHTIASLMWKSWREGVLSIQPASFQKEKPLFLMSIWECSGLQKLFSEICHKWCTFISFNGPQLQARNISEN